jgi:uracil-DNA glycosylase
MAISDEYPGAVYGYGDANADFHVIGDHPGVHGGAETGVPFTDSVAGRRLQSVLASVEFAADEYDDRPDLSNCFLSYRHPGVPFDETPTEETYDDLERFLDAELRAINAHILMPVGDRPLEYVLREHTSRLRTLPCDATRLHAADIRGRGFLVVPVADPNGWTSDEGAQLESTLARILDSDYRQTKGVATRIG